MPAPNDAKPLIMGTRSILAWQRGTKTQTRRLVRPQPLDRLAVVRAAEGIWFGGEAKGDPLFELKSQPYAVGDLLWIREALVRAEPIDDPDVPDWILTRKDVPVYEADRAMIPNWTAEMPWTWKRDKLPAMFMPRWACRYYAKVVSVRPEQLIDIGDEDAVAEGTLVGLDLCSLGYRGDAHNLYHDWWDSMHKKPGTRSQDNPWVWVYGLESADAGTKGRR